MRMLLSKVLLCSLPLILFAAEAMARAGGGGGGSGRGGGIITLILAPFFIIYYLYRQYRLKLKSSNVKAALKKMAEREKEWNEGNLLSSAMKSFKEAQHAWSTQNLEVLRDLLHPSLYPSWESDIKGQIARNERNEITGLSVEELLIIDVQNYKDDEKDNFTVYIRASCKDRILVFDHVISEKVEPFEELWTFEWENGKWTLLEVTQIGGLMRIINRKIINEAVSASKYRKSA
jgi:hypothetical protein